jgi:hypothetical protein
VARLVPAQPAKAKPDVRAAVEAMKLFRKGRTLGCNLTVRDLIEEGRRFYGAKRHGCQRIRAFLMESHGFAARWANSRAARFDKQKKRGNALQMLRSARKTNWLSIASRGGWGSETSPKPAIYCHLLPFGEARSLRPLQSVTSLLALRGRAGQPGSRAENRERDYEEPR